MPYNENTAGTNSSDTPITPDGYPFMTATVYWCLDGRKFDDGSTTRILFCVGNGHWSYPSVDCHCTLYWLVLDVLPPPNRPTVLEEDLEQGFGV